MIQLIYINDLNSKRVIFEKKSYKDIYHHKYRDAYNCNHLYIIFVKQMDIFNAYILLEVII